jgi:RNA polymerase sigma factor (TIGR02999 family)
MEQHSQHGGVSTPPDSQHWTTFANWASSTPAAAKTVDKMLYDRLRRVASQYLSREAPGHPFEPADLVHEVFLRLARSRKPVYFQTSDHFLAVSVVVMRHILLDHARSATIFNRVQRIPFETDVRSEERPYGDTLAMRQALERLARSNIRVYRIVELHVFKGLTFQEIGRALSISSRTAKRGWKEALAHLRKELDGKPGSPQSSPAGSASTMATSGAWC